MFPSPRDVKIMAQVDGVKSRCSSKLLDQVDRVVALWLSGCSVNDFTISRPYSQEGQTQQVPFPICIIIHKSCKMFSPNQRILVANPKKLLYAEASRPARGL